MKTLRKLLALVVVLLSVTLQAQSEDRNKIEMVINHQGKTITAQLATVGFGITRYKDYGSTDAADASKATVIQGNYYLSITLKNVSTDFLKLLSKKQTVFNGTIKITDTYGKNPPREIKFTGGSVDSYSDQFSTTSYDDGYPTAAMALSAKTMTINGVEIE